MRTVCNQVLKAARSRTKTIIMEEMWRRKEKGVESCSRKRWTKERNTVVF
jgi:hypothetical protein